MAKQKGMSFVEKAGLFFGIVGVLADFTALISFAYGFANLDQFTPSHISSETATSFFRWLSGLLIVYAWFISSWYLTRRTFVLRYERPRGYKNPLDSRSQRTIFGIGLFLVPAFIFWSTVNIPFKVFNAGFTPTIVQQTIPTLTPTIEITQKIETETPPAIETITLQAISTSLPLELITTTPEILVSSTPAMNTPTITETSKPSSVKLQEIPTSNTSPSNNQTADDYSGVILYYIFIFPSGIGFFGFVIYACINSLMPIVHVELLDDYE